uniref:Uncharacterized protein n=1 Tax=Rhizophora mucronata TaxID=61149 RepID=A0A2P2PHP2_RHIMU
MGLPFLVRVHENQDRCIITVVLYCCGVG